MFRHLPRCSENIRGVLINIRLNFQEVLDTSETYIQLPRSTENKRTVQRISEKFVELSRSSGNFRNIHETYEQFQELPRSWRNFQNVWGSFLGNFQKLIGSKSVKSMKASSCKFRDGEFGPRSRLEKNVSCLGPKISYMYWYCLHCSIVRTLSWELKKLVMQKRKKRRTRLTWKGRRT